MNNKVIISGSGPAGLQATRDFADSGFKVHLIESSPFLENDSKTYTSKLKMNTRQLEVFHHPNVKVWTNTTIDRCVGEVGNFQVELRKKPRFVDITKCTDCGECVDVCPVSIPGSNHTVIFNSGQPGCMAIEKSGIPPCSSACPGGIRVQGYIALIAQGRFQEAINLIREAIPFPGICGRVCTHPCEINCRRNEIDEPVAVRILKRFVSDWEINQLSGGPNQPVRDTKPNRSFGKNENKSGFKRVAIIGSGPGGMTVADKLARLGYQVTVFEKLPVIGGMLSIGIPKYRLPREVIAREYQQITEMGVEVQLNTSIGPNGDLTLDDIFDRGFEVICLAVGAHKGQILDIPGDDLPGVIQGIDALKKINLGDDKRFDNKNDLGRILKRGSETRVAVLGGGNTAIDVSRSIKRLGVNHVKILYRRTREEMPCMPEEIEDAVNEGIKIEYLVSPTQIIGNKKTGVTGIECERMKLGDPDTSGRRRPIPIKNSKFNQKIDLVVLAIGQKIDSDIFQPEDGVRFTKEDRLWVSDHNFMTSRPGVFAVGDAITRDKMVVIEAIGMGKKAAESIDKYLQGNPIRDGKTINNSLGTAHREMREEELEPKGRIQVTTISLDERLKSFSEVEIGFTAEQAIEEAKRCLACGPCSDCQACVQVCKPGAIIHDQTETTSELNIGAIIHTDGSIKINEYINLPKFFETQVAGIYQIPPDNELISSAIVNEVFISLNGDKNLQNIESFTDVKAVSANDLGQAFLKPQVHINPPNRIGVFICQCGPNGEGEISRIIDTQAICSETATWPGIVHSEVLSYSCSENGAHIINDTIETKDLNRVILAGCTCCSINQVCFSCSYQRIRCKDNLHLFSNPGLSSAIGSIDNTAKFVFVNIREQCAWVHSDDPKAASEKATTIISGSVARAMATPSKIINLHHHNKSSLIIGNGNASSTCFEALKAQNIDVLNIKKSPERISRNNGKYLVSHGNQSWKASSIVITPKDQSETNKIKNAIRSVNNRPQFQIKIDRLETNRPGIYFIDPSLEPLVSGKATAARVSAWLERVEDTPRITSTVNVNRCRACGTCIEICEFGAPEFVTSNSHRISWIDPARCEGCGVCAANCPSGAITSGYSTDHQIEAMLSVILAR